MTGCLLASSQYIYCMWLGCECGVGGDSGVCVESVVVTLCGVQVGGRDELISVLLSCDVVIYHIAESLAQVEEGVWSAQGETHHSIVYTLRYCHTLSSSP